MASLQIPVVDFAPLGEGDPGAQKQVADAIYQACYQVGFVYLKNHGIPQLQINRLFEQAKAFFDLPLAAKQQLAWINEISNRGYVGVERESLDPKFPADLKEAFNIGKERSLDGSLTRNSWPQEADAFRQTMLEFFDVCAGAASKLLMALALSLQLPLDFFTANHDQQDFTLRLLHYPPLNQPPKLGQSRAGAHSDYGSVTLLFQDQVGGLEIYTPKGTWVEAPSSPGTVLVNIGDLMQRWTNDCFRSTPHRVVIPADVRNQQCRYSAAFFCHNYDAQITCIESCQDKDHPPLYSPITAGDYLLSRLQATY